MQETQEIKLIKEPCNPCNGLGIYWVGDGSGNTYNCHYCNGSGWKVIHVE